MAVAGVGLQVGLRVVCSRAVSFARWPWAVLSLACLSAVTLAAASDETYRYSEETGSRRSAFTWRLVERGEVVEITSQGGGEEFCCRCDRAGAFVEWRVQSPTLALTASRSGHSIRLRGTQDGKPIDRQIAIDAAPWFQALSYSLRCFAASGAPSVDFWIVRPDNLSAAKLRALRRERETVVVGGVGVEAYRIRITPVGVLSRLWHGDYWFRLSDGVLLRYEGTHGLPGTPPTVIYLDDGSESRQCR